MRGPGGAAKVRQRAGALMLAHPGALAPIAVGALDVVRGRARYRLDSDGGATRMREVLAEPITHAIALPPALGGGVVLLSEQGIALATTTVRPLVRGNLTSVSIGARELWAREKAAAFDWVRIDLEKARATREPPPIAAPILTSWTTIGTSAGKTSTAGPEFASPTFGLAIVDLLGPVITRDGGQTWSPLDAAAVSGVFPINSPNRVLRDGSTLLLASDDRSAPVLSSGALGSVVLAAPAAPIPDAAAMRVEQVAPFGVPLPNGDVLITDGGRFAVLEVEAVRVARATRAPDLTRCDLSPSKHALALAACLRHQEGSGGQLAIGAIEDENTPRLVVERTFPYGTGHRFSATSALALAATCAGTSEGGIDLLLATKVCVRDAAGVYRDLVLPQAPRRQLIPRADGGVVVVREDSGKQLELIAYPRGATSTTVPLRLRLDLSARELLSIDETSPGRFTLFRRGTTDLRALTVEVTDSTLAIAGVGPRALVDASAMVGAYGDHAMIVTAPSGKDAPIEGSITSDGGRTWGVSAWPDDVRPLDLSPAGRELRCGAAGCRLYGWTRIGWQKTVGSHDRVVSLADAPLLPPAPPAVTHSRTLRARCTTSGTPQTMAANSVPIASPSYPPQANDVLLGLPPPKLPKDYAQALTPFLTSKNVRGGFVTVGPNNAPWGDKARTFARFSTDLEPLGTVYETPVFASPFPDRLAAQTTWGRTLNVFALAPGRIVVGICTYGRCEVSRLVSNLPPERIELGDVAMTTFINARELGDTLAIFGMGTRRTDATPARYVEPSPFVALVDPRGTRVSYLARAASAELTRAALTVDPTRGVFGIRSTTAVPSWTAGASYVLRLGADGRPAGAFETMLAPSSEIARPIKACGASAPGWDEGDVQQRMVHLSIDGAEAIILDSLGGALRSRVSASAACLDRLTALTRTAAFQFDPSTGRATYAARDPDGKGAKRTELACTLEWE